MSNVRVIGASSVEEARKGDFRVVEAVVSWVVGAHMVAVVEVTMEVGQVLLAVVLMAVVVPMVVVVSLEEGDEASKTLIFDQHKATT